MNDTYARNPVLRRRTRRFFIAVLMFGSLAIYQRHAVEQGTLAPTVQEVSRWLLERMGSMYLGLVAIVVVLFLLIPFYSSVWKALKRRVRAGE